MPPRLPGASAPGHIPSDPTLSSQLASTHHRPSTAAACSPTSWLTPCSKPRTPRSRRSGDLTIGPASDSLERDADLAADAVMERRPANARKSAGSARVQRTPWGVCPAGTDFGATKDFPEVFEPAEERIVKYYVTSKGSDLVFTNFPSGEGGGGGPYYEYEGDDQFIAYYRDRFLGKEHKLKGHRVTSRVEGTTEVPADEERETAAREFALGQTSGYYIFEPTKKQPDLLDFGNHTVWDVTSELNAGNKKTQDQRVRRTAQPPL